MKNSGKAITIDLSKHAFEEFETEMGDSHMSFNTGEVYEIALKYSMKDEIRKMEGIHRECSGRSAQIFAALIC